MNSQTEIFRRIVRDYMRTAPVRLARAAPVSDAVDGMRRERATSAIVVDSLGRPVGILTEQDIVRRIAFQAAPDVPVETLMTAPVVSVDADGYLFHAVALMRRRKLRHIPVVNGGGELVGELSLHEALGHIVSPTMKLIEDLTHEESIDGLRRVKSAQIEMAEQLFRDSVPVPEVQELLTEVNNDIHRRILRRAVADMAEDGWGAPPVAFAAIVMGSGGRGENFLQPDQDTGFVLADYDDEDHNRIDAYFVELAQRLTRALEEVGFPLCKGNVMATNPTWRKSLSQWQAQIAGWMRARTENTLRHCDIFFDFRGVFGDPALARALRDTVTDMTAGRIQFLRDLFALEADHTVALGWFGRLVAERDKQDRPGMIDLKYRGTLPLVEGARLLALKAGIPATGTLARLDGLRARGILHVEDHDYLRNAFSVLTTLLLRQQIADFKSGREVGNAIAESALSKREKSDLVSCFRAIENLRGVLKSEFSPRQG